MSTSAPADRPLMASAEQLPAHTMAVMVHKQFTDRVINALMEGGSSGSQWRNVSKEDDKPTSSLLPMKRPQPATYHGCQILDEQQLKGVSKNRRGYKLVLIRAKDTCGFANLLPMARKNISWGSWISHSAQMARTKDDDKITLDASTASQIVDSVFGSFDPLRNHCLRVDVYPRDMVEQVCLGLQDAFKRNSETTVAVTGPFEGPIPMTMSASRCTHRLCVIFVAGVTVYWGLMCRTDRAGRSVMEAPLNHLATDECTLETMDPSTCKDKNPNIPAHVPVSRAYYKLLQVWEELLEHESIGKGLGLDIGASPGGWTQVLLHKVCLPKVVAVDPGDLAQRVLQLHDRVYHAKGHLSEKVHEIVELATLPYSFIVCDASMVKHEVFASLQDVLNRLGETSQRNNQRLFALPLALVLTVKLPFKTAGSVNRHIADLRKEAPTSLARLAESMYNDEASNVKVRYQIVHLMANSDSERTLVAIMEEKRARERKGG